MNPTPHIIPSALLLLGAFFIGCLIGYALKRMFGTRPSKPLNVPTSAGEATARGGEPRREEDDQTLGLLPAPLEGKPDDLKLIKGVGPKLESRLHEQGVYHFHQIAAWDAPAIVAMNARLSFNGRIERERWVSQAQALVKAAAR